MKRALRDLKKQILNFYSSVKSIDELPFRMFRGDFAESSRPRRVRRQNPVSVEDLRPQKRD
jgi:hypothetical protein